MSKLRYDHNFSKETEEAATKEEVAIVAPSLISY